MPTHHRSAEFRVHPDELLAAGQAAHNVAMRVLDELSGVLGPSDETARALRDTETGRALSECTAAWQTLLTNLSGEIDRSGQNLVNSAQRRVHGS